MIKKMIYNLLPNEYKWALRANKLGQKGVVNIYNTKSIENITSTQWKVIEKSLKNRVESCEVILDFGSGWGRFSGLLSKNFNSKVIAYDPIDYFISKFNSEEPHIFAVSTPSFKALSTALKKEVDLVFISLVLGGLNDREIIKTANLLVGTLSEKGCILYLENISEKKSSSFWRFRTEEYYLSIFPGMRSTMITSYWDTDEHIGVFFAEIDR